MCFGVNVNILRHSSSVVVSQNLIGSPSGRVVLPCPALRASLPDVRLANPGLSPGVSSRQTRSFIRVGVGRGAGRSSPASSTRAVSALPTALHDDVDGITTPSNYFDAKRS